MKMPIFTIFVLFILALTARLHYSKRKEGSNIKAFWDLEAKANSTRMKDISNLDYIKIPNDLPLHHEIEDIHLQENIRIIDELKDKRIFNLTGMTNTEVKLEYGAPNITRLSEYDLNYTNLVRAISKIGEKYIELDMKKDAITILDYGICINTDVRLNYELLASLYSEEQRYDKIQELKNKASELNSLSKEPILRSLDKLLPV